LPVVAREGQHAKEAHGAVQWLSGECLGEQGLRPQPGTVDLGEQDLGGGPNVGGARQEALVITRG